MSQRPRRQQQPFRFWLPWSNRTPTPTQLPRAPTTQQTPSRSQPSSSSQPESQPRPQRKSPQSSPDVSRVPKLQTPSPPPSPQLRRSTGQRTVRSTPSSSSSSPSPSSSRRSSRPETAGEPQHETQERSELSPPPLPTSQHTTPTELFPSEIDTIDEKTDKIELVKNLEPMPETTPTWDPKSETLPADVIEEEKPKPHLDMEQDEGTSKPSLPQKHDNRSVQVKELDEEKHEPEPKEQETKTVKSDTGTKELKERKPEVEPEEQNEERQIGVSEELSKRTEPKLSIAASDLNPTSTTEPEESKEQPKTRKVSKIAISTIPRDQSPHAERANLQKEIKDGLSKLVQKLSVGNDQGLSIITLAGQNKGATMVISNDGITNKIKKHENDKVSLTVDKEKGLVAGDRNNPLAASINSNVQSINNSLLNESCCKEGNPGVHLSLSTRQSEPTSVKGRTEPVKAQKMASDISTPQKLTYEPNIRRRCLIRFSCDEKKERTDNDEGSSRH